MPRIIADRVMETTTTTGTGTLTLAGAVAGYQSFGAVCGNGDTVDYSIFAVDAAGNPTGAWETGVGTFVPPNGLARLTFQASSTGAPIDFGAGSKIVVLSENAASLRALGNGGSGGGAFKGARVLGDGGGSPGASYNLFNSGNPAVEFDVGGFWNATNYRFKIPAGVGFVEMHLYVGEAYGNSFAPSYRTSLSGVVKDWYGTGVTTYRGEMSTGVVKVTEGDWLEPRVYLNATSSWTRDSFASIVNLT